MSSQQVNTAAAGRYGWAPGDYAITFSRVSDEIQTTIPDQIKMGRACAADLLGLPVPVDGDFTEVVSRSQFEKRIDLQAALERMKDPHCRAVIMWIPSRMFGDPEQTLTGYRHMSRYGVRLFDKNGREEGVTSHLDKLMGMLQGWQSEGEVIELRKRIGDTHRMKAADGRMISRPPYGVSVVPVGTLPCHGERCIEDGRGCPVRHGELSKKGTVWTVDPSQQAVLVMLYEWAASGIGYGEMVKRLAEQGVVSPVREVYRSRENKGAMRGGSPWSKSNIRKMLKNDFYRGIFVWNTVQIVRDGAEVRRVAQPESEWIYSPHSLGPFVDAHMWAEAQRQVTLRHKTRDEQRVYPARVFSGLVYCGRCGWRMYPRLRGQRLADGSRSQLFDYICVGAHNQYSSCTKSHAIPESWLFSLFGSRLGEVTVFPNVAVSFERQGEDERSVQLELKRLDGLLREIVDTINRVEDMAMNGEVSREKAREKKGQEEVRRLTLMARRDELLSRPKGEVMSSEVPEELACLADMLGDGDIPVVERRLTVSRLIERIVVDRPQARVVLTVEGLQP